MAWYLVTIIDAHVDASLFDYDITDDLKASVVPGNVYSRYGLSPGVNIYTYTKHFKTMKMTVKKIAPGASCCSVPNFCLCRE